jgi:hypothetical protein
VGCRDDNLAVFKAHGTRWVYHYTTTANTCGIFTEGMLYSRAQLIERGIEFSSDHYFGDAEKEEILSGYVSLANQPPWGMMKDEKKCLVIMRFDLEAAAQDGSCYCPGWSPEGGYAAREIVTWTEPNDVEDLYPGAGSAMRRGAEIFTPGLIGLQYLDALIYFDEASRDSSIDELRAIVARTGWNGKESVPARVQPERFPPQWKLVGPPWQDQ